MTTPGGNIQSVPLTKIITRPDLFQFRDDAGGYDKDTVDTLVRTWDWDRYDPLTVARDPDSDQVIVLGGHHRYEAIGRLPGENPDQAADAVQVRVIEGDIRDAANREELQRQAILSNYSVRGTSLLADSEAVKRFEAEGQSPREIADAMNERRTSKVRDLSAFGELHLGDRQFVQTVPDFYPVGVELGYAVKRGMSPDEAGALLVNIRKEYDETGRLPSRAVVKSLASLQGVGQDTGQQAGFALGDTSVFNAVRQMAADNTAMETEISKLRRELQICERLGETTHVDVSEMRGPILARLAELQGTLDARNESLLRGGELPPRPGEFVVPTELEAAAAAEPEPASEAEPIEGEAPEPFVQPGPGLFAEDEPPDDTAMDMWGEAVAVEPVEDDEEPAPFVQEGPGLFDEPEPAPGMGQATMGDDFATNRTLGMPMGEGRAEAAPLADPDALMAAQERRDAMAAGQTELAGVDTDFDGVPDVSLEDSDGDGLPDAIDAMDDRGHDDADALQEAAVMVGRDPETGEEVKVAAYKVDDGLMAIEVQSDGEPGSLFEAASEAAMEVAAETPADTAPPLSDTWRQDFEESLSVLNDETFEGDEDWTDLRNYIDEIQASRDDLAGTEVLAWADRWESEAQRSGAADTSEAVRDLRDSLEASLGVKPAPVAPAPRNPLEMFGVGTTETSAAPAKGKRGRRGKKAQSADILTERAGATAVVPPPVLVMR